MNVVDSSGWLEYFADGPNASFFAAAIEDAGPSICVLEVFKRVLNQRGEDAAFESVGGMLRGYIVDLDVPLATAAARIGSALKLALADSVVLAMARAHEAVVWTQDADFERVPDARFVRKRP